MHAGAPLRVRRVERVRRVDRTVPQEVCKYAMTFKTPAACSEDGARLAREAAAPPADDENDAPSAKRHDEL